MTKIHPTGIQAFAVEKCQKQLRSDSFSDRPETKGDRRAHERPVCEGPRLHRTVQVKTSWKTRNAVEKTGSGRSVRAR